MDNEVDRYGPGSVNFCPGLCSAAFHYSRLFPDAAKMAALRIKGEALAHLASAGFHRRHPMVLICPVESVRFWDCFVLLWDASICFQ
jgi:hypothetical protein